MGAIADALVAYARPLMDETDGSLEQLNRAFSIAHLCYNLAMVPENERAAHLSQVKSSLNMEDAEFDDFTDLVINPMIQRHEEMFPRLHGREPMDLSPPSRSPRTSPAASGKESDRIDRYAPCPCNSGRKYKFCCGRTAR